MSRAIQIHILYCKNIQVWVGVALDTNKSAKDNVIVAPISMELYLDHTCRLLDNVIDWYDHFFPLIKY